MPATERPAAELMATLRLKAPDGNLLRRLKVATWFLKRMGLRIVGPITIEAARTKDDAQ